MWVLRGVFLLLIVCEGKDVTFNKSNYKPFTEKSVIYSTFINATKGVTDIDIKYVPSGIGFYIIQVHSYIHNITLSSTKKFINHTFIQGTNVGLVGLDTKPATYYIHCDTATTLFITVTAYQPEVPIPGGCNLTFDTENAPYQLVSNTNDLIIVQSQAPSVKGSSCDNDSVTVDLYHMYLHENNFDQTHYFDGLQKMMTVEAIKANGYKVNTVNGYFKYRKLYSSYRGVGHVFAIIATNNGRSSAYVPAISYGCNITTQEESCYEPSTFAWTFFLALMIIFGIIVSSCGCLFSFVTEYFVILIFGLFLISFIVNTGLTYTEKIITCLIVAVFYGSLWTLIKIKCRIPFLSLILTHFFGGFLFASLVYYVGLGDMTIYRNDTHFWLIFFVIILSASMIWLVCTPCGLGFAHTFIGGYALIGALSYFIGGNLHYIAVNVYRRMTVANFNMATIDPPFQIMDIVNSIFWVIIILCQFLLVIVSNRSSNADGRGETASLLENQSPHDQDFYSYYFVD